jgi:putative membrane protein
MLIQKQDYFATLPDFLAYFAVAVVLLVVFLAVYTAITPQREFALVRQGNVAAATSLTGALVGFVLPLASVITHSQGLLDVIVWGVIALVVQIVIFLACRMLVPGLPKDIEGGRVAPALLLGGFAVGVGALNAACMTY